MKKRELIDAVAETTGMKKIAVEQVLETAFSRLADGLAENGEASLWALGKLKTAQRKPRQGRNQTTGETIEIPAKTIVKIVVSKELAARLNP